MANRSAKPESSSDSAKNCRISCGRVAPITLRTPTSLERFCDRAVFLHGGRVDRVLAEPEPAVVARVLHELGERSGDRS